MTINNIVSQNVVTQISPEVVNKVYDYTVKNLETLVSKTAVNSSDANILIFVNLALNLIKNTKPKLRYLQSGTTDDTAAQVKNLLNVTNTFINIYISTVQDFPTNSSTLMKGIDDFISFHIATSSQNSLQDFVDVAKSNNLVIVDLAKCLNSLGSANSANSNFIVTKVDYSTDLNQFFDMEMNTSSLIKLGVWDFTTRQNVDLSQCKGQTAISIKYPLTKDQLSTFSMTNYRKWKELGVDSLNPNDPVFLSRCSHLGDLLKYDTTQNYRRSQIFQNTTLECENGNCSYNGIDESDFLECMCQNANAPSGIYSKVIKMVLPPTSEINLDLAKCNYIAWTSSVRRNAGFWIGIILVVSLFVVIILHKPLFNSLINNQENLGTALKFDEIKPKSGKLDAFTNRDVESNRKTKNMETEMQNLDKLKTENMIEKQTKTENVLEKPNNESIENERKNEINTKDIVVGIADKQENLDIGFCRKFANKLFEVHPVLSLFCRSLVQPFGIRAALFIFNFFMYFGFNAFIFTDSYIRKRVNDDTRVNYLLIFRLISLILCVKNSERLLDQLPSLWPSTSF